MHKAIYRTENGAVKVAFNQFDTQLPILLPNGQYQFFPWGRRAYQQSLLPLGGMVNIDAIDAGRYDRYFPRLVKLPITDFFMTHNQEGTWYSLPKGKWIQGMLITETQDCRVYIVMLEPNEASSYIYWPRIITGDGHEGQ